MLDVTGEYQGATTWTFTSCGASGPFGPSAAACTAAYTGTSLAGNAEIVDGVQRWTAPVTGTYRIAAWGAQGASGQPGRVGGSGAVMMAAFNLTAGDGLSIVVGQPGSGQGSGHNGGGGGGSFVVQDGAPLLVAGGGGGTRAGAEQNGCNAQLGEYGGRGSRFFPSDFACTARTDRLGLGELVSQSTFGSGGAGFFSNGQDDPAASGGLLGQGGRAWASGMTGGAQVTCTNFSNAPAGLGEFGGGGTGEGCDGGGGGGYSGGDGGLIAAAVVPSVLPRPLPRGSPSGTLAWCTSS